MKKALALMLAVCLVSFTVGCGGGEEEPSGGTTGTGSSGAATSE